jgi:molybdenum cofactor cytidylyltransferase
MVCAIILAAGRSTRMGEQKLLLPLGGKALIARVVDEVLASPVDEVVVVVGSDEGEVRKALAGRRGRFVRNTDQEGEMLSSVRRGLEALPVGCIAVLVVLGDQPSVTRDVIAELVAAFGSTDCGIVVPTHRGHRGHPLLFAAHYREEVLSHYDDVGLRGLLHAHPDDTVEVESQESGILEDMDDPGDYLRARGRFPDSRCPGDEPERPRDP